MIARIMKSTLVLSIGLSVGHQLMLPAGAEEKVLTTVVTNDLADINPHLYDTQLMFAQAVPFEGLVDFNQDAEIIPMLAESWEISSDGTQYTFKIREGVKFSDGEPLNATAVEKNFQALMDNVERHEWMDIFALIEQWEAIDEYTFELTLSSPYAATLNDLGNTRPFKIISPKQFVDGGTKDGVKELIGTGAYVLGEHETDEFFEFDRNDNYWGEAPDVDKYVFKVMPDVDLYSLALEKGDIDFLYGTNSIGSATFKEYENKDGFTTELSGDVTSRLMVFNSTEGPLNDPAVREALAYGVDREEMAEALFDGLEQPAGRIFSKESPYANLDLDDYTFDPDRVNQVLDEAGWEMDDSSGFREKDGQLLELNPHYITTNADEKEMAEYLQASLLPLGIHLNLIGEEAESVRDRYDDGSYDIIFRDTFGPTYDPFSFTGIIGSTVTSLTWSAQGMESFDEVRERILSSQTTTDEIKRQEDLTLFYQHCIMNMLLFL